jgi:4-hydroxymandelate oxidase
MFTADSSRAESIVVRRSNAVSRRRFLQFLAGSPLLAGAATIQRAMAESLDPDLRYIQSLPVEPVDSPARAINVFDLEATARRNLPAAHYGYIATGVTDEYTQRANRDAFRALQLRARRLIDVGRISTSTTLFGQSWPSPIGIAPCSGQTAFHPQGELAVARAARSRECLQILSTFSTKSVEDVNIARGEPVWFQLYMPSLWSATEALIRRAEAAGCQVLVVTVDTAGGERRETLERFSRLDARNCAECHGPNGPPSPRSSRPMLAPFGDLRLWNADETIDWDDVDMIRRYLLEGPMTNDHRASDRLACPDDAPISVNRDELDCLRKKTSMKLVIKGIVTAEDARLCVEHGVDGVIVSNHGGRQESSNRGSIESLPEVVAAVANQIPVMLDGGIRRGSDVFKALALGASKVFIGRPYLWGLGAFGQDGVERVIDILREELIHVMKQAGTPRIDIITRDFVTSR